MITEHAQPETEAIEILGDPKEWLKLIVFGFFAGGMQLVQHISGTQKPAPTETSAEIMNADEVAAFLGLDRNTIYDYAGRGVIPHQRIGKRILFRRGALVSWLDTCKATSTRKG